MAPKNPKVTFSHWLTKLGHVHCSRVHSFTLSQEPTDHYHWWLSLGISVILFEWFTLFNAGVRTMAKAYVNTPTNHQKESLTNVKCGYKECTQVKILHPACLDTFHFLCERRQLWTTRIAFGRQKCGRALQNTCLVGKAIGWLQLLLFSAVNKLWSIHRMSEIWQLILWPVAWSAPFLFSVFRLIVINISIDAVFVSKFYVIIFKLALWTIYQKLSTLQSVFLHDENTNSPILDR